MARITNRAAAALAGKNEAAKKSSDFCFGKSQRPSQNGKLSSSPVSRTRVVIFVSRGFRSTDYKEKRETARSLQHLHRKRETRIYFKVG